MIHEAIWHICHCFQKKTCSIHKTCIVVHQNIFKDRKRGGKYQGNSWWWLSSGWKETVSAYECNAYGWAEILGDCVPLNLTLQAHIEWDTQLVLGNTLQGQFEILCSKGFVPVRVHMDQQRAFQSITTQFKKVEINVRGAGDYIPKIDTKIWCIKEMYCNIKSCLLWT